MRIIKVNPKTGYLYHFTRKSNIGSILKDKAIKSGDDYVFFTESLSDSVTAFYNEIMSVGKPYIDADCNLRYRERCSKDDYCILRIPYVNDGRFYKFEFDDQPEGIIYQLSIAHKGQYDFKRAKILEIPDRKGKNGFARLAAAGLALGIMLTPYKVFADSWLDDGNYDVSWYDASVTYHNFSHSSDQSSSLEKRFAGASYISNHGKFEGTIKVNCTGSGCGRKIDLSSHSWTPLRGVYVWFDGIHRIILKYGEKKFTQEDSGFNEYVSHYTNIKAGEGNWTVPLFDKTCASDVFNDVSIFDADRLWEKEVLTSLGVASTEQLLLTHNGVEVFGDEVVSDLLTSEADLVEYLNANSLPYSLTVEDPSRPSSDNIRRIFSEPSADIKTIREKISVITGIPASELVLTTDNSTPLEDGKTPSDYNIADRTQILYTRSQKPAPGAEVSGTLTAKMTATGRKSMLISWKRIQGAAGYDIFLAKCNHKGGKTVCRNVKTISGNTTFRWTKKGLKKNTAYKGYVKAYVINNGQKEYVKTSPEMHAFTGGGTKKYTNAKSVKVNRTKVALKKGSTFKIRARVVKLKKNRKLMPKSHAPALRYITSDSKVATVNRKGKITARGRGSCTVYACAHNGVMKAIKVTVK